MTGKARLYARISVATEESVSVNRQLAEATSYAEGRGWKIGGVYTDSNVSATRFHPAKRPGWKALMADVRKGDVVIIWRLDRLVRKTLDLLEVQRDLEAVGASLAACDGSVDFTTPHGRLVTQMLAAVADLETANTSARIRAARSHIIKDGRSPGGAAPYGWINVPNPNGKGVVRARDPERIQWVQGIVERAQAGMPTYSIVAWLNEAGAPLPTARSGTWTYSVVARLLANPVLAGLTPFNPGYEPESGKERGPDVVRDDNGLPLVDPDLAIMPLEAWRRMNADIEARTGGAHTPRASRRKTSPLLSGLLVCGHCDEARMVRGTWNNRDGYKCTRCHQTLTQFEDLVVRDFLAAKGPWVRWTKAEVRYTEGHNALPELDRRIEELKAEQDTATRERRQAIYEEIDRIYELRDAARADSPRTELVFDDAGFFDEAWTEAGNDVDAQRAVLDDALERIIVVRGGVGVRYPHHIDGRLTYVWRFPEEVGERQHTA